MRAHTHTGELTWRQSRSSGKPRLHAVVLAGLLLAAAGARAYAAGSICRQDCAKGACSQTLCDSAGPADGYCRCSGGSQSWGGPTHSSWCVSWGQPLSSCVAAPPVIDERGHAVSQPTAQITQPEVVAAALRAANPWVATLISALHDGKRWVEGPAQGLIHDSYFDAATGVLSHTAALPFTGQVTSDGLGAAQIDIVVAGDVAQLSRLKRYAAAAAPAAIPPRQVHGAVTAGGLHGSLQVTAADGRTQAIQW